MKDAMSVFGWLPCPVVFICTAHQGQRDIMTATAMFVSEKEPLVTVSVASGHLTERLMAASDAFVLAIASTRQQDLAIQVGSSPGDMRDKYEQFDIRCLADAPNGFGVPSDSAAWLHCRVKQRLDIPGYSVAIARAVESGNLGEAPMIWHEDAFFSLSKTPGT
jgi:flavin reductase (DIM6/NTAB) family NADH-FMN oxidoreductase RutF